MKTKLLILFLLIPSFAFAGGTVKLGGVTQGSSNGTASGTTADTTNFNNNLSSADDTVQKALETLDETAGGTGAPTDATYLTTAAHAGLSAEEVITTYGLSIVQVAGEAAFKTLVNLEAGVDYNAYDANLPTWPSTVDATEVGYLNGLTDTIVNLLAGKHAPGDTLQTNSSTTLPATCTVGEIYLDTDADTDGELYLCVATNTWKAADDDGGAGGMSDIVEDLTPQLGGPLDVNNQEIQSNGNIAFQLGDDAGVNKACVQDSASAEVWCVDSNGNVTVPAMVNPTLSFDQTTAQDYYIGAYDTTDDQVQIRTSSTPNTGVITYWDANQQHLAANMNLSTGHVYQINGVQIDIGDLGAAGNWTPTGTIDLSGATVTLPSSFATDSEIIAERTATKTITNTTIDADDNTLQDFPVDFCVAASDESTDLTTGTAKVTFRAPWAFTLTDVRASVNTAPVGSTLTVDVNEAGVSVFSTIISIDASEETSVTAATAAVISDSSIADDAEMTIDIDQIGSTTAGKGLKVCLYGKRTF